MLAKALKEEFPQINCLTNVSQKTTKGFEVTIVDNDNEGLYLLCWTSVNYL